MKCFALLALSLLLSTTLFAQTPEKYSRVEISLAGKDISVLTQLGIETDHGLHAPGHSLVTDLASSEILQVQNAGFQTKIWIDDLKKDYLERLQNPGSSDRGSSCASGGVTPYPSPANYTYGTMGGYHTLEEMMAVLDDMHAKFPNLISARADASDTIETWEGRKIQYVKISDNPDSDEAEPEVLYSALHHAREPNGASQMLFYMWYLLENYATDPEVQYILNNAELYFIPCVNPDGYVYNETTDPQGGGYWRKNLRDNGDGTFGVDLNRNYGHFWGNDDSGSSPATNSQTYRGPAPFSEPETRTMRDFVRAHEFVFALNYHTFSNLLIYPWAYNNLLAEPALAVFGKLFTRENHYKTGTSIETVGYNVNGSSDDWMYAEGGTKSFTPEVGKTGFWPQPGEIEDLNRENVWQNLSTALCALRFGEVKDISPNFYSTFTPNIEVELTRYGYEDGAFLVSLTPLSANIASVAPNSFPASLTQFETKAMTFNITLQPSVQVGEEFTLLLTCSNGVYEKTDTLHKFYGGKTLEAFNENGNSLDEWNGGWDKTLSTYVSAPYSITDSPGANYESNTYSDFQLSNPGIYIPVGAKQPQLRFWAKWDLETRFDFVQLRASGNTDQALCGRYTKPGSGNGAQPFNEPIFDGFQEDWVEECMDMSDFIGQIVDLKFILGSDNGDDRDGFYFDDLRVEYIDPTLLYTVSIPLKDFRLQQNEPNPAGAFTIIRWENLKQVSGNATLLIYNQLGVKIAEHALSLPTQNSIQIGTQNWPAGLYTYRLQTSEGQSQPMKMTVVR
ncbi:MAG: M14 family zinc carboxypeptidase [Saprospiraceae bacterium]|nr:M14 family zinc carboxypeptidase [Saprospiraceae bacterium]